MDDWKKELEKVEKSEQDEREEQKLIDEADDVARQLNMKSAQSFLDEQVKPAFADLEIEIAKYVNNKVSSHGGTLGKHLEVERDNGEKFIYGILVRLNNRSVTVEKQVTIKEVLGKLKSQSTSSFLAKTTDSGKRSTEMPMCDITKDVIIQDFMEEYKTWKK